MDAITFGFVVIPSFFAFVGFVFFMVFSPEIVRWYRTKRAEQRGRLPQSAPIVTVRRFAGGEMRQAAASIKGMHATRV
jgi:uncharacterized membrane protein